MKKSLLTLVLCSFAFGLGFGMNNVAFSDANQKIAYVNVTKLVQSSKTLKSAQSAKEKQEQEMLNWFKTASADINKQSTKEGKEALVKKYETQLNQKKKTIADAYIKKVNDVDKQLNDVIQQKSKDMGYDLVLRKESVLFGGVDITDSILPLVK